MCLMSRIIDFFADIWHNISVLIFSSNNLFLDIVDILIVTFIIYKCIQFIRETRAEQLMKGIVVFLIVYFIAQLLNLRAFLWIVNMVYMNAIVVIVVLFQPELRSILERMGRGGFTGLSASKGFDNESTATTAMIDSVCKACVSMRNSKTGALIVIERKTQLSEIAATGTIVDAAPSKQLVENVFYPKSPLHDGAMIVRDNRVYAAACILPLTQNTSVDPALGTRHRAAIGVSEISDAIVVIVSEETGIISVAQNGIITRNYTEQTLRELLENDFVSMGDSVSDRKGLLKIFKRKGDKDNE